MAFNPINFANIEPQGNPGLRDFISNLAQGYKAGQLPQQLSRQAEQERLANTMKKLLLEEEPQKFSEQSQGRQLKNAFQTLLNQEQPQKFDSKMASDEVLRAFQRANTNKVNTMTPLQARELAQKNELYPELTRSQIESNRALSAFREAGGSGSRIDARAEKAFQMAVAQDNPHLTEDEIYEASNVLREGGDSLSNGTKLNPLSPSAQGALDRVVKTGTTATITANKKTIQAIHNVLPIIEELKTLNAPWQVTKGIFSPNKQAEYEAKVAEASESLATGLRFPQTNKGISAAENILGKRSFETETSYKKRLDDLVMNLKQRESRITGKPVVEDETMIDGQPFVKINGKWGHK